MLPTVTRPFLSCVLVTLLVLGLAACARSDADVRAAVETQLAVDPATATGKPIVTVERGVVKLSGEMSTREGLDRAVQLTREVRGVKDVVSSLRLADAAVADAVKQAVAADATVGRIPLAVEVKEGVVRLVSDQTNKDERQRIVQITSGVFGVTKVEDWMR